MSEKEAIAKSRRRRGHDISPQEISDKHIELLYKTCTALYNPDSVQEVVADVRSHLDKAEFTKDPRGYLQEHFPWRDDELPRTDVALIRYLLCRLGRLKVFRTDESIVIEPPEQRLKR